MKNIENNTGTGCWQSSPTDGVSITITYLVLRITLTVVTLSIFSITLYISLLFTLTANVFKINNHVIITDDVSITTITRTIIISSISSTSLFIFLVFCFMFYPHSDCFEVSFYYHKILLLRILLYFEVLY